MVQKNVLYPEVKKYSRFFLSRYLNIPWQESWVFKYLIPLLQTNLALFTAPIPVLNFVLFVFVNFDECALFLADCKKLMKPCLYLERRKSRIFTSNILLICGSCFKKDVRVFKPSFTKDKSKGRFKIIS